jgi:hypothetical protein
MMPGQGKSLPSFMERDGEWIVENYIFLYHSDESRKNLQARFTVVAARHDGDLCIGFDSAQLASALGVDIPTLITANQNHSLVVLGVTDVPAIHGGKAAKEYGFQLNGRIGSITVETDQQEGTA